MDINGLYLIIGQQQAALVEMRAFIEVLKAENAELKRQMDRDGETPSKGELPAASIPS